ncbi:WUSCHEL-related homeobox 8 [Ricinus communis]|uniref:DNA binding protein, putative n=1 Tax=Ricinus communis TaxID=3988 RepID=B9R8P9_RICCO|nr:WUSCHEL-related homeobox 8 [Ricinus communis]XP_048226980.1 WUSCHEL-related homeobox 8 [Ricinus communis]EEF52879.1 DNA binding protein, putative [Ricinus communis]|eukprot:XP_002510692.1 WUSCHEL-related homeobox 8 [Ricinus communis]
MEEGQYQKELLFGSGLGVKVMTDDQMETLRKQISVYATICESLVQMHKAISDQNDFSGMRLQNPYAGPFFSYTLNKIPSRQRWAPKAEQLEILESIFTQSKATPGRQRIKEIATQLSLHGPISETNVYNWFQNRRARSKRKQSALAPSPPPPPPNNRESQVEVEPEPEPEPELELETAKEKRTQLDDNLAFMVNHMYFHTPEIGGIDQLIGKAEVPMSYDSYWQVDQHDLL